MVKEMKSNHCSILKNVKQLHLALELQNCSMSLAQHFCFSLPLQLIFQDVRRISINIRHCEQHSGRHSLLSGIYYIKNSLSNHSYNNSYVSLLGCHAKVAQQFKYIFPRALIDQDFTPYS